MPSAESLPRAAATGAALLDAIRVESDALDVEAGVLHIDGADPRALVEAYGSPLYVTVERTLRANYRRIHRALAARWPAPINVLYSIKANNTLAIRRILTDEGAGGDCFGMGELTATLRAGTDPRLVAMNGSNKTREEIDAAIAAGVTINVDGTDELDYLREACARQGRQAQVNLRLKVLPAALDRHVNELNRSANGFVANVARVKWGYVVDGARPLVDALRAIEGVDLTGYSCHIGHLSKAPEAFGAVAGAFAEAVAALHATTGFVPRVLDLGGGWAQQRDPSFREAGVHTHPVEAYVEAAVAALRSGLPADMPLPALWIEPGRYIVGNAVLLLARVGAVKHDAGRTWFHVDASTNNLPRIESGQFHYTLLPASRMLDPLDTVADIVGSTCFRSVLGSARAMPALVRGDLVAILDAGMYAEVFANQFNGVPRPGGVLVSAHGVDEIRRRETIDDVFRDHRVPEWLALSGAQR
jgi:diaminopimelate decarboxylase